MPNLLQKLFNKRPPVRPARPRLTAENWPSVVYAIGDIHGCRRQLDILEQRIIADAEGIAGAKWLVLLGDYIDRGPNSAAVLDKLCAPPPSGFRRICLAGNHEVMMLHYLANPETTSDWLEFGGVETLMSYDIDMGRFSKLSMANRRATLASHIPVEHIELLQSLPVLLSLPLTLFVHAGIRRGIPVDDQSETDLLWMREPFLSDDAAAPLVIHGHTPGPEPVVRPNRICVDTGAFATGILTAVRMSEVGPSVFINSGPGAITL